MQCVARVRQRQLIMLKELASRPHRLFPHASRAFQPTADMTAVRSQIVWRLKISAVDGWSVKSGPQSQQW